MAKVKYYVVWDGVEPGVYDSWTKCQQQINGYPNAKYKSYKSKAEADKAYVSGADNEIKKSVKSNKPKIEFDKHGIIFESWSVDAACSGNPGVMEYQGVHTKDGSQIFHQKFPLGTNNIGEFLGIVHALALLKKLGNSTMPIYTDSRNAMLWINKKKAKTTLIKNNQTKLLFDTIGRAESWLKENSFKNPILKWETKKWGEIPADFGRK
jgi:ribonuclease HI